MCILHFGRVFNYAKTIFKLILKTPTHLKGGWLGDHALYALLKIYLNMYMKWVAGSMSYTLDSHLFSIDITIDIYGVYSYLFLYMYASTSNNINLDWYLHFHTYICVLISLYL